MLALSEANGFLKAEVARLEKEVFELRTLVHKAVNTMEQNTKHLADIKPAIKSQVSKAKPVK